MKLAEDASTADVTARAQFAAVKMTSELRQPVKCPSSASLAGGESWAVATPPTGRDLGVYRAVGERAGLAGVRLSRPTRVGQSLNCTLLPWAVPDTFEVETGGEEGEGGHAEGHFQVAEQIRLATGTRICDALGRFLLDRRQAIA